MLTRTDGEGNKTTYKKDLWGRAAEIADALGIKSSYTFDNAGNVTSSTDGNGNTTIYAYNSLNRLASITDPAGKTITYKYDREGRLRQENDRNGQTIQYGYNSDNNLTGRNIAGKDEQERFLYNKDGSLLAAINPSGVDAFEYTADNLIKKKVRNGKTLLEYQYNKNGQVTGVTDGMGNSTGYVYDALGRLNIVKDETSQAALYSYNPDSTLANITYGTGAEKSISTVFGYDRDKNVTSLVQTGPKGTINSFSYTYDNNGNRLAETLNGKTTLYTYDNLQRLEKAVYPGNTAEIFVYDNAGNRLSRAKGDASTTYTYDANTKNCQ